MTGSFSFYLLIFGQCLVIQSSKSTNEICGKGQYTINYPNGTFLRCLSCETCHEGRGLEPPCGSTLYDPPVIKCRTCKFGTFSSKNDISSCLACHHCAPHEIKTTECTNKSDTVCSGKCEKGYYMTKAYPPTCRKCSACCSDGKDERIDECVSEGINEEHLCSPRQDKNCGGSGPGVTKATKDSGGLSTTSIILITIGCVIFVSVVVIFVMMVYYKRKRRRQSPQQLHEPAGGQSQIEPAPATSHAYVTEGPQAVSKSVTFSQCVSNPVYQEGTPCAEKKPVPGTSTEVPTEEKPGNKNVEKASMSRQVSQESQTSGDGQFRKRSFSSRSFGEIIDKVSLKRDDSLLESDQDYESEKHVAVKISKHPKSQAPKEGSKVELSCKLEKKNKNFMYQWFKDDAPLIGKNEATLVLDPVQLRDFGSYMCRVSYRDSFADGVNSTPAKLDVIPVGRNGMRLKLLSDLDIDITTRVALLLQPKKPGLGDWRGIASKYGMETHVIDSLDNDSERGKKVLDFVHASKATLTVYDFCKTLKEDKFRRLDIVQKLEDHFLVAE